MNRSNWATSQTVLIRTPPAVAPRTQVEIVLSPPSAADLEVRRLRGELQSLRTEHAREIEALVAERDLARTERDLFLFLMRREDGRPAPVEVSKAEQRVADARAKLQALRREKRR
jgi:hypothetical protein